MTGTPARMEARFVSDVMISRPKTHRVDETIGNVRAAFENSHVHMVLLTRAGVLHGTLVREDISADLHDACPALDLATLRGRTAMPDEHLDTTVRRLQTSGQRRIPVVDDANNLLGLVCLKADRAGFCTDDDARARSVERSGVTIDGAKG